MTKRFLCLLILVAAPGWLPALEPIYVKRDTRAETEKASLAAIEESFGNKGVKQSVWKIVGPFENLNGVGVRTALPPELKVDLSAKYSGVDLEVISWKDAPQFKDGEPVDLLGFFKRNDHTVCFLYRTIEVEQDTPAVIYTGSDDTLQVWLNGTLVNQVMRLRSVLRDDDRIPVQLKKGTNTVLMKIGNFTAGYGFYYRLTTRTPTEDIDRQFLLTRLQEKLNDDFGTGEASYYRLESIHIPAHIVLEVGGMAFRPDGKMFICTRRGEVWVYDPKGGTWKQFAAGLHEPLGVLVVNNNEIIIAQRPELTRLKDTDGDGEADLFETVTDAFGVSGNYHEYHFGPVRDREGNLYGTLNLGWENLAFSRTNFRGWAYKVTPQGQFIPYALGLRSPSGIGMSPDGDVFVTDSQGDWWGASPLLHLKQGAFYGHPASLVWTRDFPKNVQDPHMIPASQLIPLKTLPAAWFVYGPLGQAPGEPLWDTTGGKFGPFAGQMFAGDETKSCMLRVALEKVGGEFQGAIFPFRFGFASGLLRGAFAADGTLYNGMTDRGWASVGGHPFGLQRVVWSGKVPMEVHSIKLTKTGFDLTFTKPVNPKTASLPASYSLLHFYYLYHFNYGSPKQEETPVKVTDVKISADGRTVSLKIPGFVTQKIYEFHLNGINAADGTELLHTDAYYTLNRTIPER